MVRNIEERLGEARGQIERLSPQEAARALEEGATLIDTRCSDDRSAEGTVPGSLHFPLSVLEWRADPSSDTSDKAVADFDRRLILMCNDGFSSSLAGARSVSYTHLTLPTIYSV